MVSDTPDTRKKNSSVVNIKLVRTKLKEKKLDDQIGTYKTYEGPGMEICLANIATIMQSKENKKSKNNKNTPRS